MQSVRGWTVGDDRIQRIMILAFAIRHSMERPAIGMEGGQNLWRSLPAAVCQAFEKAKIELLLLEKIVPECDVIPEYASARGRRSV